MSDLNQIQEQIARLRSQVIRQRRDIAILHSQGLATADAEALLLVMKDCIKNLGAERSRLNGLLPSKRRRTINRRFRA